MNYVDSLEVELAAAGIPARRRARIVAEFSDHLHENPEAELGAPRDLARQFADELGTRLARGTAYRAFAALAVTAIVLVVMFFNGGFVVDFSTRWNTVAVIVGPALIVLLLAMLPDVFRAARLRPTREGTAGDLTADLGIDDPRATPRRIVVVLSVVIVLVMVAIGVRSDDLYDGILRGLFDGAACLVGFAVLGQYLGLRRSGVD